MGILQTPHTCYEIEKRFSSIVEELIHLPAIYCHQFHCSEILLFCDRLIKPCYVKCGGQRIIAMNLVILIARLGKETLKGGKGGGKQSK